MQSPMKGCESVLGEFHFQVQLLEDTPQAEFTNGWISVLGGATLAPLFSRSKINWGKKET